MSTILVAEDDPGVRSVVEDYLRAAGFTVETAPDGERALQAARMLSPDLIVLDLGLPKRDGLDVVRELRRTSNVPVVILTARGEETDKILGLEMGTDDYIVKPFSPRELVARVRAVLRRSELARDPEASLKSGDVEVEPTRLRVTVAGRRVELTASEVALLAHLVREPGRVFTRAQLLDALRGVAFESFERAIDSHVKNIRRKIEPDPGRPRYIQTVYGLGYRFAEPGAEQ